MVVVCEPYVGSSWQLALKAYTATTHGPLHAPAWHAAPMSSFNMVPHDGRTWYGPKQHAAASSKSALRGELEGPTTTRQREKQLIAQHISLSHAVAGRCTVCAPVAAWRPASCVLRLLASNHRLGLVPDQACANRVNV